MFVFFSRVASIMSATLTGSSQTFLYLLLFTILTLCLNCGSNRYISSNFHWGRAVKLCLSIGATRVNCVPRRSGLSVVFAPVLVTAELLVGSGSSTLCKQSATLPPSTHKESYCLKRRAAELLNSFLLLLHMT